jgi:hypothetical protein
MAPDTQQNIIVALFLLVAHNFFAIAFLGGAVISTGLALYKPSRGAILMIIGFTLLLFAFEYQKHIVEALLEQTKGSLITERQSYRLEWVLDKTFGKVLPPFLYLVGSITTAAGIYFEVKFLRRARLSHYHN